MLAYKTKLDIDTGFLQLQLPAFFKGKQVEIIVLEVGNNTSFNEPQIYVQNQREEKEDNEIQDEPNEFQKFLLTAPTWSDKEYENFIENRKIFNQWKIK